MIKTIWPTKIAGRTKFNSRDFPHSMSTILPYMCRITLYCSTRFSRMRWTTASDYHLEALAEMINCIFWNMSSGNGISPSKSTDRSDNTSIHALMDKSASVSPTDQHITEDIQADAVLVSIHDQQFNVDLSMLRSRLWHKKHFDLLPAADK